MGFKRSPGTVVLVGSMAPTGTCPPGRESGLQLSVQLLGHLHWLVRISQNDSLVPAVSEPPLVAVPSTPQGAGPSLHQGCGRQVQSLPPLPLGAGVASKAPGGIRLPGSVGLVRCLHCSSTWALSLPWGQNWDKPLWPLWAWEGSLTPCPFPWPWSYGNI